MLVPLNPRSAFPVLVSVRLSWSLSKLVFLVCSWLIPTPLHTCFRRRKRNIGFSSFVMSCTPLCMVLYGTSCRDQNSDGMKWQKEPSAKHKLRNIRKQTFGRKMLLSPFSLESYAAIAWVWIWNRGDNPVPGPQARFRSGLGTFMLSFNACCFLARESFLKIRKEGNRNASAMF